MRLVGRSHALTYLDQLLAEAENDFNQLVDAESPPLPLPQPQPQLAVQQQPLLPTPPAGPPPSFAKWNPAAALRIDLPRTTSHQERQQQYQQQWQREHAQQHMHAQPQHAPRIRESERRHGAGSSSSGYYSSGDDDDDDDVPPRVRKQRQRLHKNVRLQIQQHHNRLKKAKAAGKPVNNLPGWSPWNKRGKGAVDRRGRSPGRGLRPSSSPVSLSPRKPRRAAAAPQRMPTPPQRLPTASSFPTPPAAAVAAAAAPSPLLALALTPQLPASSPVQEQLASLQLTNATLSEMLRETELELMQCENGRETVVQTLTARAARAEKECVRLRKSLKQWQRRRVEDRTKWHEALDTLRSENKKLVKTLELEAAAAAADDRAATRRARIGNEDSAADEDVAPEPEPELELELESNGAAAVSPQRPQRRAPQRPPPRQKHTF